MSTRNIYSLLLWYVNNTCHNTRLHVCHVTVRALMHRTSLVYTLNKPMSIPLQLLDQFDQIPFDPSLKMKTVCSAVLLETLTKKPVRPVQKRIHPGHQPTLTGLDFITEEDSLLLSELGYRFERRAALKVASIITRQHFLYCCSNRPLNDPITRRLSWPEARWRVCFPQVLIEVIPGFFLPSKTSLRCSRFVFKSFTRVASSKCRYVHWSFSWASFHFFHEEK